MTTYKLPSVKGTGLSFVAAALVGTAVTLPVKLWCRQSDTAARAVEAVERTVSPPILAAESKAPAARAIARFAATSPRRASDHFHRWRFAALGSEFEANAHLQGEMQRFLRQADFRQTFPQSPPLFFRSPYGWEVRQRTAPNAQHHWEYEHHVDQFLATCAEIGVPLALPIETDLGRFTVGELLDASRRSFDASQETCWSLVAFCKYLPDEAQWENRFGETCSYEAMAKAILAQPLDRGSCGGTHKQFALAFLLRHGSPRCITADLRQRSEDYLMRSSRLLERSQLPNGAWSPQWAAGSARSIDPDTEPIRGDDLVRITGHQLEWIEIVPDSLRPTRDCVARSLRFLIDALGQSDSTCIQRDYCAYSHAACVLKRALDSAGVPSDPASTAADRFSIVSRPATSTLPRLR